MTNDKLIRVTAPGRLHFGLLSLPTADGKSEGVRGRHFGGVGLMVQEPAVQVTVQPAPTWSVRGPLAERALAFAQVFVRSLTCDGGSHLASFHIEVEKSPAEHTGLGTGTQLGLAVARGLACACGRDDLDTVALAQRIGRGARSALGIHGFGGGGLVVDGGKGAATHIAPLLARFAFPPSWRILLVMPHGVQGLHGLAECEAFGHLGQSQNLARQTDRLCRVVLLGLLPALVEQDLPSFGEALFELNHRSGEMYTSLQGGPYANQQTAALVECIRQQGIAGAGQSSWGPTIFAVAEEDRLQALGKVLRNRFALDVTEMVITSANNEGASCCER